MKLETNYNVGDKVWAMCDNRPTMYEILKVFISYDGVNDEISYRTDQGKYFFESDIFPTKEALLKSL